MKNYTIQKSPFVVPTTDGKVIEEHHGIPTTENTEISIAHMIAPPKWSEPFQTPEFEEYTYIIKGKNKKALFIPDIDKWEKWDRDLNQIAKEFDFLLIVTLLNINAYNNTSKKPLAGKF